MPHIHWVERQNKLEIPNDEEDVNNTPNVGCVYYESIHWVVRGTGTPKDRDEVNNREVSE
jgi:hypothetical protein